MNAQYNAVTKLNYQGRNQVELLEAKARAGYKSDAWATFLQIQNMGRKVTKGTHGVSVFKGYGQVDKVETQADGAHKYKSYSRPLGWARVFNLDQTEPASGEVESESSASIDNVDAYVSSLGI